MSLLAPFFYLAAERSDELAAGDDEQHGVGWSGSDEPAKLVAADGLWPPDSQKGRLKKKSNDGANDCPP